MPGKDKSHLSDEDLLLFLDRELSTRQATRAREHVARCEPCRVRLASLDDASAGFADLHDQQIHAHDSPLRNSRELLKTRLAEVSARRGDWRRGVFGGAATQQLAGACLALLMVVAGTWAVRRVITSRSGFDSIDAEAVALPRRTLTPGSTRAVQVSDLCSRQDLDNDPPVNPSLEQAVFSEYGLSPASKKDYELDYLISPSLGGTDTIENLWPQPYSSTWNARAKDRLEDHLHELVCQGKVQLATAQNDMSSDWIAAYKRYFNTEKPGPDSSGVAMVRLKSNLGGIQPAS